MKKLICLVMVFLFMLPTAFCESGNESVFSRIAQEAAEYMTDLCENDIYIDLFMTSTSDIHTVIEQWKGDWSCEEHRIRSAIISCPRSTIDQLFSIAITAMGIKEASSFPEKVLIDRLTSAPASILNAQADAATLAASSVIRYSDVRLLNEADPGLIWILSDYGSDHPLVLTGIFIANDHAASISASFVPNGSGFTDGLFTLGEHNVSIGSMIPVGLAEALPEFDADMIHEIKSILTEVRITTY